MKKLLAVFVLIMVCSVNVFAVSTYVDQETGTEITLPENWSEVPLLEERQYLDAKFMNSDKTAMITYSSLDLLKEMFSETEVDELREHLNMSSISIEDAKEIFSEEGYGNFEKVTYNNVDYFKAELTTTHIIDGQEYDVDSLQFIHFNNGWIYYFVITKESYYEYYDSFKSLIESVKYPHSARKVDVDNSLVTSNKSPTLWYYELFQQEPKVYIPIILIMFVMTFVAYAIFPLIFALTRKKITTKRNYNIFCYGTNFLVMLFFIAINGKALGSPYFLWTYVFSIVGANILKRRKVLEGYQPSTSIPRDENAEEIDKKREKTQEGICEICGATISDDSKFCYKCGTKL